MRVGFVESIVACPAEITPVLDDEHRNEPMLYAALFSTECRPFFENVFETAMGLMRGRSFADCDDALEGLAFLQEVAATALWRYRCVIGDTLSSFAREFDRLDVPGERKRLYARAQTP